ncbi:MAG TPA: Spy/CpxP family protein refolding chaperone [Caulobacteraceae bacterium]|jgi:hypothetical protein|nr:Spy/CpxP family protein refolding chaperone [Caulobacteraceae bacterium]
MNSYRKLAPALAAALGLSLLSAAVYAQDGAGASPPPGRDHQGAHRHWDPAAMKARGEARRAEHVKMLHDALSIRPDQEAAFQAFVGSMHHGEGMHRGMGRDDKGMGGKHGQPGAEREAMTTPERLDHMQKRMAERDARFQQHADAVKAFYAALSPEQQHTFDALGRMRGRGGEGRHHGMRHDVQGPEGASPPAQG